MNEDVKIYEDSTWGKTGKDIIPSRFYQVYKIEGTWLGDDESTWYGFDEDDHSTATISPEYPMYEANKIGLTKDMESVEVTIVPNENLVSKFPNAQVRIDYKYYDLGILNNPIKLHMDKDHKISIIWSSEIVESFRIIKIK